MVFPLVQEGPVDWIWVRWNVSTDHSPVLYLPDKRGRFHLYLDTSKFTTGSALCQIQIGKPKLIAYASKRQPEAAQNYSITE